MLRVRKIYVYGKKDKGNRHRDRKSVNEREFISRRGDNDDNTDYGKYGRDVSFLHYNTMDEFVNSPEGKLCLKKNIFGEDILVEGDEWDTLSQGDILIIGSATFKLSFVKKHCILPCGLKNRDISCPIDENWFFASVLETGKVRVGDNIKKQ